MLAQYLKAPYLCPIKNNNGATAGLTKKNFAIMSYEQLLAAAEKQSLESIFADAYSKLYTDECENINLLLFYDLDENKFAFKNDEQGQYRSAFEQQNNVITIGYVDVNSALTRNIEDFVEFAYAER